jgi:hypothetical protein
MMLSLDRMEKPLIIGEKAFAAITAVEGLCLPQEIAQQIEDMRRKGYSNDAIRAAIIADFDRRDAA